MKENKGFKSFAERKKMNEAMGYSRSRIEFMINQPMANLLSLIPGHNNRARALNWLTIEGLLEASMGREELLDIVNKQISGIKHESKLAEVRGDDVYSSFGSDASNDGQINSEDLFSPEAYQRRPELRSIRIQGKTIPEYYDEHFEPTYMSIESRPGEYVRFNLKTMRQTLESMGLAPFKYGGFDGYLQFMEKGDYLPEEEKRQYMTPNNQYGVDLRPAMTFDKEKGGSQIGQDVTGEDERGNAVINFAGGSASADQERANKAIDDMRIAFSNIMHQIENKRQTGLPPEEEKIIHDLLTTKKQLEKAEIELGVEGSGKEGYARKLGLPDTARGPVVIPVTPGMDLNLIDHLVKAGLDQESTPRDLKSFNNPDKLFGPQWDGTGPKPQDGYYRIQGDQLIFKLPKAVQERIYAAFMAPLSENPPMLGARFELGKFFPHNSVKKNIKLILSGMYNAGAKSNPELVQKAKMYVHKLSGINPKHFTQAHAVKRKEIQTEKVVDENGHEVRRPSPNDPIISELMSKGYRWELFTKKERETKVPDWIGRAKGILFRKGSRYKIAIDDNDGKFYIYIPVKTEGTPTDLASRGVTGQSMLGGNITMSGGLMGGHINYNRSSSVHSKQLIDAIKQGKLGEPEGPHSDETMLPCVLKGAERAKRRFETIYGNNSARKYFGDFDLVNFGVEGLQGFTGDSAFQVGYVTDAELEKFLKSTADEELEKEIAKEKEREEWGDISDLTGGRGINVLLHRLGKKKEEQDQIIDNIVQQIRNKTPLMNLGQWGAEVEAAFGKNAFAARVRHIANYVLTKMTTIAKSQEAGKTKNFSALSGEGKDGKETRIDPSAKGFSGRGEYVDPEYVKPSDLAARHNIELPSPQVTAGAQQPIPAKEPEYDGADLVKAAQKAKLNKAPQPTRIQQSKSATTQSQVTAGAKQPPPSPPPMQEPDFSNEIDLLVKLGQKNKLNKSAPSQVTAGSQQPETDFGSDWLKLAQQKRAPLRAMTQESIQHLLSLALKKKKAKGIIDEIFTSVIFDPKKKSKTGCGFNIEGQPGGVGATSIGGEADTSKSDPTGKKGKHGKK